MRFAGYLNIRKKSILSHRLVMAWLIKGLVSNLLVIFSSNEYLQKISVKRLYYLGDIRYWLCILLKSMEVGILLHTSLRGVWHLYYKSSCLYVSWFNTKETIETDMTPPPVLTTAWISGNQSTARLACLYHT